MCRHIYRRVTVWRFLGIPNNNLREENGLKSKCCLRNPVSDNASNPKPMNYLAHLYLAENTTDSRIGNFLGDFVKGDLSQYESVYAPGIIQGIQEHRYIDSFIDRHPMFIQSKRRLGKKYRLVSGIVIDILADHFLTQHWQRFSPDEDLETFLLNSYRILSQSQSILPTRLQKILPRIIEEDWLRSYQTLDGVEFTLIRLSKRLTRQNTLPEAIQDIQTNYDELATDFLIFFPDLIRYVEQIRI
jgi:acyl carrier protein phosphodiesterase